MRLAMGSVIVVVAGAVFKGWKKRGVVRSLMPREVGDRGTTAPGAVAREFKSSLVAVFIGAMGI